MNTLRHIIKCSTLCVLMIIAAAISQESGFDPGDLSPLDSLLLSADVKTILSLSSNDQSPDQSNNYYFLIKHLQEIAQASEQTLQKRCRDLTNASLQFQQKNSGVHAEIMFTKFQKARSAQNWKEALTYYSIALYFRSQYILNEKTRLKSNLATAEELYRTQRFNEVLQAVEIYKLEDHANPAYQILKDSLAPVFKQLEMGSRTKLNAIRKEQAADIVTKQLTVAFSYGFSSIPSQPGGQGVIRYDVFQFDTEPLPGVTKPHYAVQFDYFLSPYVSLSAQIKNGQIYSDDVFVESFSTPDPAKVYFQEDYSSWTIGFTVYSRNKTGIRPFARLLMGVLNAHMHEAKMQSSKWESWGVYATLDDMHKTHPYLSIETGVEFEPGARSLLFFGFYLSVSNEVGKMTYIKNFSSSVDFRIGINVL
jgi:hypothetical protein